ncbi:hypothetical protein ACQQ2T_05910 [Paraclostridium tenue]|uniref:Uncharacterized protein n=1 Tax=Paeniclostridium hominis TaxID=2764329 RepID=A0ABR7K158_9FIRM|nr:MULTISPECIES: hypothetical protein [Paeniclostridium]MBC6002846.1 hypothetical protein [Paeniclostridium hominis]
MFKFIKIFIVSMVIIVIFSININSLDYYDLYFEKISENIVKGNYETLHDNIKYKTNYNLVLSKDEIDLINYNVKINLNGYKKVSEEDALNKSKTKVRPVYKKIKGNIIKDYKIWNQRKQIIIQVPIDIEFI